MWVQLYKVSLDPLETPVQFHHTLLLYSILLFKKIHRQLLMEYIFRQVTIVTSVK